MEYVGDLAYEEAPDYALLRQLFHKELTSMKSSDKPDVLDWVMNKPKAVKVAYIIYMYLYI